MKHAYRFAFAAAFCALMPSLALTSVVLASALLPSMAHASNPTVANPPVAKPMSAWLVGPSQASSFDSRTGGKGCLMVTEFDNGIIIGLHAREEGIIGMTVDNRNAGKMTPGDVVPIALNIGQDAYALNAHAGDATTLSIDLAEAGGGKSVAERLTRLGAFRIVINDLPHHMATTGFTDGLARLQACMGGMMAVTMPVVGPGDTAGKVDLTAQVIESMRVTSSGHETPLALAMPNLVPAGYRFVLDNVDPMTLISWQAGDDWLNVMRTALAPHGYRVLVEKDVIRIGKREVTTQPVIETAQINDEGALEIAEVNAVPAITDEVPNGVWAGAKGQNLADVLEAWGLMSGVNVKVDLDGDYKLTQSVRFEGRFDEAVQHLLAQFDGDNRPSGTFLGLSSNAAMQNMPAPVGYDAGYASGTPNRSARAASRTPARTSARSMADSTWRPSRERVVELRKNNPITVVNDTEAVYQMPPIPDPANAPKTVKPSNKLSNTPNGTWLANQGTSLRHVFEKWGTDAGVEVIWLTEQTFPLSVNIQHKGAFEDALGAALAQFAGQGVRPAAQLNEDPETGKRVLIINAARI